MTWITIGATLSGVLSVMTSLISSPSYLGPVTTALVLGALSLVASVILLISSKNVAKWAILIVSIPVAVFTIDNIGRIISILHLGGFRILI